MRPVFWEKPAELNPEMLLSMNPPLFVKGITPSPVCACNRNWVVAPEAITLGSVDGEPKVPAVPASPVLTTTVTPARTAALLASEIGSFALSGNGLPPKDSLITSTSS